MFGWIARPFYLLFGDAAAKQAVTDQKKANYPGCGAGRMKCYSFCDCVAEELPSWRWLRLRAKDIRKRSSCSHTLWRAKYSKMFPELKPRGQECLDCGSMRLSPEDPWTDPDD